MILTEVMESPEQITEALLAQAGKKHGEKRSIDLTMWHNYYSYLRNRPKQIDIPYSEAIVEYLPTSHDKIKRDFPQILSLIEASALLHCNMRNQRSDGTIIADEDDYKNIYELVNEAISQGLSKSVPDAVRLVVEEVGKWNKNVDPTIQRPSITQLAEVLNRDQSSVSRNVAKAVEEGFLRDMNPGQGRESRLELGDRKMPSESVPPHPSVLFPSVKRTAGIR
jgi:hypothetical protein